MGKIKGGIFYIPADIVKKVDAEKIDKDISFGNALRKIIETKKKKKVLENWH